MRLDLQRLLPRRIAPQIAVIVLIGTLFVHGTLLVWFHLSSANRPQPGRDQMASLQRVMQIVTPSQRAAVIAAFPDAVIGPCGSQDRVLLTGGACASVIYNRDGPPGGRFIPFYLALGPVAVVVALLSFWAARRVTAPLARLVASAQHLGRFGEPDILPEEGPEEIRGVARAYNIMQRQIQGLVAERTRMLAALSHDIRTILTRLVLRLETAPDSELREKGLRDVQIMSAMVASTLAFAEGLEQQEAPVLVDLSLMLDTLCDEFNDLGFSVTYEGVPHYRYACRLQMLSRALRNLIDNATKYGGDTRVALHATADGGVHILVEDDGPGIAECEHERIFEPFYRLDAARNVEKGGAGLGLTILRTAIAAHGGKITLANRQPQGLAVTIALPSAPKLSLAAAPAP